MPKITLYLFPQFTSKELQEVFGVSQRIAFFIKRLCLFDFAPEEIPETAAILEKAEAGPELSDVERILLAINGLVGGRGLKYLQDRNIGEGFPYIDREDHSQDTLFNIYGMFMLSKVGKVVRKYGLIEEKNIHSLCR